ncbi:MAG: RDD family protein [Candidatus Altiarchaeota archaeon]
MAKALVGKRIVAFLIDGIILLPIMVIFSVVGVIACMAVRIIFPRIIIGEVALLSLLMFVVVPFAVIASFIIYGLLRDIPGGSRSIGKKIMGLKVVKNGAACDKKGLILRNVTLVIPLINLIDLVMGLVDKDGLRIGDKIAKTEVVEA